MFESGPAAELRELMDIDPGGCPADEVLRLTAAAERVRAFLDAYLARLTSRAAELERELKGIGPHETLRNGGTVSSQEARKRKSRAEVVEQAPTIGTELAKGGISADHVDAVARAADQLAEEKRGELFARESALCDAARSMTPEKFQRHLRRIARELDDDEGESKLERQRRKTSVRRWIDRSSGMYVLNGEFDPETGAKLFTAIDRAAASRAQHTGAGRSNHDDALALAQLVSDGHNATPGGRSIPELQLVVDRDTHRSGLHDESICELQDGSAISPETARRLCCEAVVTEVALDASGIALECGRYRRVASAAQRSALRMMYPTCAWDGCETPFHHCQIHHVIPWEHGGPTDLDNLLPLCSAHHHAVHEGGWTIALHRDRTLSVYTPAGDHHGDVALPSRERSQRRHHRALEEYYVVHERLAALRDRAGADPPDRSPCAQVPRQAEVAGRLEPVGGT